MRYYSEYTLEYVQTICDALNEAGLSMEKETKKEFAPEHFKTLTYFLQNVVVMPISIFTFLNEKGLVNRNRCPYTGNKIDSTFPKWTYMNTRSVYVSHEGISTMKKEDDEEYVKIMGHAPPSQQKKKEGCYIATVCYGNERAPEVITLKFYRDEVLSKSLLGRMFIKIYYLFSPTIARQLVNKKLLNDFIRIKILNIIILRINKRYKF